MAIERLMALDIGERRIGIALSESGFFARPYTVLSRTSKKKDFARLKQLITELEIDRLIIGLPYSLSGYDRLGPQAHRIQRYAEKLAQTLAIPIEYFDESYSTIDAEEYLAAAGQKNVPLDAAAAAVILQNYLDAQD